MAKRKHKLVIKNRAMGYQKSRAKGRTGKGQKIDVRFKTLGKRGRKR